MLTSFIVLCFCILYLFFANSDGARPNGFKNMYFKSKRDKRNYLKEWRRKQLLAFKISEANRVKEQRVSWKEACEKTIALDKSLMGRG